MKNLLSYELFESMPSKIVKEIRLIKTADPKIVVTVTADQNNRITDIRNPFAVTFPFRLSWVLNKSQLDKWMEAQGFKRQDSQYKKPLKGHEMVKYIMKRGY